MLLLYMAEANAVNFTDGMDGLCAGVSFIGLVAFYVLSMAGKQYNIALFIACILGGLLGYLKFNFKPAKIFMGDSGSLALGALFASLGLPVFLLTDESGAHVGDTSARAFYEQVLISKFVE